MTPIATVRRLALCVAPWLLVLLIAVAGCGGGNGSDLGTECYQGSECASGICLDWACSAECSADADCGGGLTCSVETGTSGLCVESCPAGVSDHVCVGGRQVSCEVADDAQCETCGCADAGTRCEPGVGCVPLSRVNEACSKDADCETLNCSPYAGVCRVPVGSTCSIYDCDRCITGGAGYSFCSRECGSSAGFEGCHDNAWCLAPSGTTDYVCKPKCATWPDPSCPGACRVSTDGASYCDCPDCPVLYAPRELGDGCAFDSQCSSGDCYERSPYGANSRERAGVCTSTCGSDAECGDGAECVDVPCQPGETESCGAKCLATCDADRYDACQGNASCRPRGRHGADGFVDVCDVKGQAGAVCDYPFDCDSGRCLNHSCAPVGGASNGGRCAVGTDCQSGSCPSGVCRGTSLIGGACTMPYDCAVGTCCPGSNDQGVCRASC